MTVADEWYEKLWFWWGSIWGLVAFVVTMILLLTPIVKWWLP